MQRSVSRFDALDRNDCFILDIVGQHRAGVIRDAVDQYGACAAFSAITADFGAGQIEFVPQSIGSVSDGMTSTGRVRPLMLRFIKRSAVPAPFCALAR